MNPLFFPFDRSFLVRSETDQTVGIAQSVSVDGGVITWEDQNGHERAFTVDDIHQDSEDGSFVFTRDAEEGGGKYRLIALTDEQRELLVSLMGVSLEDADES